MVMSRGHGENKSHRIGCRRRPTSSKISTSTGIDEGARREFLNISCGKAWLSVSSGPWSLSQRLGFETNHCCLTN